MRVIGQAIEECRQSLVYTGLRQSGPPFRHRVPLNQSGPGSVSNRPC
jgi:hypothetical protein